MFCNNCGQKLNEQSKFCSKCGALVNGANDQSLEQNLTPVNMQKVDCVTQPQPNNQQQVIQQPITNPAQMPIKKKKRHGCLITFLVFLGIIAALAIAVYLLLPGLFKPYDLDVKSSKKDYESTMEKLQLTKDDAPRKGTLKDYKYIYGEPHAVDTSLNSKEITSFFNENRPEYYALKNVQVRINKDDTIEASAKLDVNYLFDNILDGNYDREDVKKALPMLDMLPEQVNIYLKFEGALSDNQLESIDLQKVSVMGIPIPDKMINSSEAQSLIETTINSLMQKITAKSGTYYEELRVEDGEIIFKGEVPSSITRILEE